VSFHLASLTLSQLALPAIYIAVATVILVAYLPASYCSLPSPTAGPARHLGAHRGSLQSAPPAEQVVEAVKATTLLGVRASAVGARRAVLSRTLGRTSRLACGVAERPRASLGPVGALPGELRVVRPK